MNKKILVAEDDKFLSSAYRLKLTNAGYDVLITPDGQQLFDQVKDYSPDLIILDLVMPIVDGFTALEQLKSDSKLKSIPVIVASNLGQKEDIDRTLKLGANDFVIKSNLSLNDLLVKIKKLI